MNKVGLENTDILLDELFQPVASETGDFQLVREKDCFLQDVRLEAATVESELPYEDEEDTEAYGFSMVEFTNQELDDFTRMEIEAIIKEKLGKREEIDEGSIHTEIGESGNGFQIKAAFKLNDARDEYNVDISTDEVEVVEDD